MYRSKSYYFSELKSKDFLKCIYLGQFRLANNASGLEYRGNLSRRSHGNLDFSPFSGHSKYKRW
jgi:hypothetical protein